MIVGVLRVRLRLPGNHSLKGKRAVILSLMERLRRRYNLAVAEVDENDRWQTAVIGICCVGNAAAHINAVLDKALDFIEQERLDLEVLEHELELIHAL